MVLSVGVFSHVAPLLPRAVGLVVSSEPLDEKEIEAARTRLEGPVLVCHGPTAGIEAADALLAMEEPPPPSPAAHTVAPTHRRGEYGEHAAQRLDPQFVPRDHRARAPGVLQYTRG